MFRTRDWRIFTPLKYHKLQGLPGMVFGGQDPAHVALSTKGCLPARRRQGVRAGTRWPRLSCVCNIFLSLRFSVRYILIKTSGNRLLCKQHGLKLFRPWHETDQQGTCIFHAEMAVLRIFTDAPI